MVGNDIVDLKEAKRASNWQRPRFLDKLFTPKEQDYIKNAKNSFEMVWRLWSIKEASYKLFIQIYQGRFYNPKAFECTVNNGISKVKFKSFECFVATAENAKYILSEARLTPFKMDSKVIRFNESSHTAQSKLTQKALMVYISKTYKTSLAKLIFYKSEFGTPLVYFNSKSIKVSMSHHGNFGAFVIV